MTVKPLEPKDDEPRVLYKYRFFDPDGLHIMMIEESEIWFSSARSFNDPFDSSLQFTFDGLNSDLALNYAKRFVAQEFGHLSLEHQKQYAEDRVRKWRSDPNHVSWYKNEHVKGNYNDFGICSLTPMRDSLLMWSHYGDAHRGFCVGLDMKNIWKLQRERAAGGEVFDLYEVAYADGMPQYNFFEHMKTDHEEEVLVDLLMTKSKDWSYEREYRLIRHRKTDFALSVGEAAVAEVVLGCRISLENEKRILCIVEAMKRSVPVYKAAAREDKFALKLDRIR